MTLESDLIHPSLAAVSSSLVRHGSVAGRDLPEPQRLVAEALIALLGSARMPNEMREYAEALNAALDPEVDVAPLMGPLRDAHRAARGVESARSGMGCDLALSSLQMALDDLRDRLAESPGGRA